MSQIQKSSHQVRFFSNPCMENDQENKSEETIAAIPFGLNFQEDYPIIDKKTNGFTYAQSPTQTPTGVDSCADVDVQI